MNPRYVRFGPVPKSGRSIDPDTGETLAGVCCYEGDMITQELFRINTSRLHTGRGTGHVIFYAACDRMASFVWGVEVGEGPDGEPLVAVERLEPVPSECRITSVEEYAQPALNLWSRGPRDDSGRRVVQWRLGRAGSPYLPPGERVSNLTGGSYDSRKQTSRKKAKRKAARKAKRKNTNK